MWIASAVCLPAAGEHCRLRPSIGELEIVVELLRSIGSRVEIAGRAAYEVSCLYPDRRLPLPLGDLESSAAVCAPCQADHVFRPDED